MCEAESAPSLLERFAGAIVQVGMLTEVSSRLFEDGKVLPRYDQDLIGAALLASVRPM